MAAATVAMLGRSRMLLEKLIECNAAEFIATAVSPWHAIGIDAEVIRRQFKRGLVVIHPHSQAGYLIQPEDFACSRRAGIEFVTSEMLERTCGFSKSAEVVKGVIHLCEIYKSRRDECRRVLECISPMRPSLLWIKLFSRIEVCRKYYPSFTVIDEGMGTYFSRVVWRQIDKRERPRGRLLNVGIELLLEHLPHKRRFLFTKDKYGALVCNKDVAAYYAQALSANAVPCNSGAAPNGAVVVTQPFSEYGYVPLDLELRIVRQIVDNLLRKGFEVRLKPHPREHPGKYDPIINDKENIVLLPSALGIERLLVSNRPRVMVGFTSTALISCNALYDIPSYTAITLFDASCMSFYVRTSRDEFLKLSRYYVSDFRVL